MNRYFIKKAVTASLFIIIIALGSVLNISNTYKEIGDTIQQKKEIRTVISEVDTVINEQAFAKYSWIELYGYTQRILHKNEENDFEVVKDENGFLHYTYFGTAAKELPELVDRIVEYKRKLTNSKTKFLYVMTPDKYIPGYTTFENGLPYHYANETSDVFLEALEKEGIDTIDFRDTILDSGIPMEDLFYKTDHHWTIQTAFWAYSELVDQLEARYDLNFMDKEYYTDLEQYNQILYPNSFIGSLGRKTGVLYSGVDDFTLIYPKFLTKYQYTIDTGKEVLVKEGRFDEALIYNQSFVYEGDKYDIQMDKYASYLYGNQPVAHIKNAMMQTGPKILMVKDSFMIPVASFLSTVCSEIYLVDPRYYEGDIIEFTNSIPDLDAVIVSFTGEDLTEEFINFHGVVK